jgi:hypothetical protein
LPAVWSPCKFPRAFCSPSSLNYINMTEFHLWFYYM